MQTMGSKKSVLVVEDELMIAIDLEESLLELGWNVVGPVAHTDRALELIGKEIVDVGLLDYNLRNDTSEQIALALLKKSVPVIFLSGDTLRQRPERLKHCQIIAKPVSIDELNKALCAAIT
jgi:two-component SAPR family response regulator